MNPKIMAIALTAVAFANCSGSPSATIPAATSVAVNAPTSAPTAAATNQPTAAPTTAAQTHVVSGAPQNSDPAASLSFARRTQAIGVGSIPNILVESSGTAAIFAGNFVVWVKDTVSGLDVTEATAITATTNGLPIDNPAIQRLCTGGALGTSWCNAHPTAWVFGTDSGLTTKPIGKQTITVTFPDATVGTFTDYVYNGTLFACGQSEAYVNGVPAIVTSATADLTYDCVGQQVIFPHGVVTAAQPLTDSFGRTETVLPTVTAATAVPNGSPTAIPFASFPTNGVVVFATTDGGFAKLYSGAPGGLNWTTASLHSQPNGSFAY